ncbi:hypothetical protein JW979_12860 [bacterium]|nr:hypothetical protein [candidate division CSSED10-310 bacterium]
MKKWSLCVVLSVLVIFSGAVMAQMTPVPTRTPTPEPMPSRTPTPTVTPTPGIEFTRFCFDSNFGEDDYIQYGDIWSIGLAMYTTREDARFSLSASVADITLFYPTWQMGGTHLDHLQEPLDTGVTTYHFFTIPFLGYFVGDITFDARLFWPDRQGGYEEVHHVQRVVHFYAIEPTPTPTPEGPCQKGRAVVHVTNIPIMTDGNKDSLNKSLLFCLHDDNDINFMGVYHRYLQPEWPYGNWWPTWRLEAGAEGCWEEFDIWTTKDLFGTSAIFQIDWDSNWVTVTHLGTGDSQTLHLSNVPAYNQLGEDAECGRWGWHSDANATLLDWECFRGGDPTGCR